MSELYFDTKKFNELSNSELYELLKLRSQVFVVEQKCAYQDLDNKDQKALHVLVYHLNKLVAYARVLPKGVSYPDAASIGRVVMDANYRGNKWGYDLMKHCIKVCHKLFPDGKITISAQEYLLDFYTKCGFEKEGNGYLEDDIPHVKMNYKPAHEQ